MKNSTISALFPLTISSKHLTSARCANGRKHFFFCFSGNDLQNLLPAFQSFHNVPTSFDLPV